MLGFPELFTYYQLEGSNIYETWPNCVLEIFLIGACKFTAPKYFKMGEESDNKGEIKQRGRFVLIY